eukprot:8762649-Pyramimonas_sp.AAC.2
MGPRSVCGVCQSLWRGRMWTALLGPSAELLWETCEGCADMGGGDACGLRHWDLRWSSYGKRVRGVPKWVAGAHVEDLPRLPPDVSSLSPRALPPHVLGHNP